MRAMPHQFDPLSYVTDADELVFLVEEVPRKLRRLFDASTARFGLTRTQWRALAYIFRTPGLTQTELAKCLELERASVGHVIDQLERAEYVERRAVEGNRRVWTLHLLPKAVSILPSLREEADAIYERLLAGFSIEEIATVRLLLSTMTANLDP
ncbi:MAG TPA: MarR family transcriptional regulator [Sphingorhabdus sp.]|jgi:DNA-binding MarR family transcriptional regulator|uniref:MarR family winged helix-turn-helix transcriptional regulator n=1 Tax=Sphingorhabdus sp. TaxID=1902408 RepID=UPI00262A6309|nr:MarR family transcriptional regulator [Sphingorhabdus sp.]HMS19791.1 MarR family transcriptional regulator [Sphingorhabdus sp.]HMT40274.1 MarR family transcriptional regulator [Sphingorhabdus sp.]HMU21335.1 MarR family transcriptional regulator [Sphingorhabdus sp.]